jgi:hypothetical protein
MKLYKLCNLLICVVLLILLTCVIECNRTWNLHKNNLVNKSVTHSEFSESQTYYPLNFLEISKSKTKSKIQERLRKFISRVQTGEVPNYTPIPNVRFVEVWSSQEPDKYLQLSQVVVRNEFGFNIAKGKNTYGEACCNLKTSIAVDGYEGVRDYPNIFHSRGFGQYFGIDLGGDFQVGSVELFNRRDCCRHRIKGAKVMLFDSNWKLLFQFDPISHDYEKILLFTPFLNSQVISTPGVRYVNLISAKSSDSYLQLSQVVVRDDKLRNIARGKLTYGIPGWSTQTSTAVDGYEGPRPFPDIYHSSIANNSNFLIDLGGIYTINQVDLMNRMDCCWERINGVKVQLLDNFGNLVYEYSVFTNFMRIPLYRNRKITSNVRYVEILSGTGPDSYLQLSQVVVRDQRGVNVAKSRNTWSSHPPGWGTKTSTAVDGNESPRGYPNIFHSSPPNKTTFTVDLGSDVNVESVELYNRSDCCWERMKGVVVRLLDKDKKQIFKFNPVNTVLSKIELSIDMINKEISNLKSSEKSAPLSRQNAINGASCSAQGGISTTGKCFSQLITNTELISSTPAEVKEVLDFIFSSIFRVASPFDLCIGDFQGNRLQEDNNLISNKCDGISLMSEFSYGILAASIKNVPCGTPQNISFCAVFDRCGTIALSLNAGLAKCTANYSTGIATLITPIADILDEISFGFSLKRRFTRSFTSAYRDGDRIASREVTTYGHFMIGLGLGFPFKDVKVGDKSLENLLTLNVKANFMVDFGNSVNVVQNLINSIKSAGKESGKAILNSIINSNAEMTLTGKGVVTLNLEELTKGFLPNLDFDIGDGNILISTGGDGNASGMSRGIYIYFKTNIENSNPITKALFAVFDKIINQFSEILSIFGVPKFSRPSINFAIGVFVQDDSTGFEILGLGQEIRCIFIYSSIKGGCNFDGYLFTAIYEGLKWVIKAAKKFFEDIGKEVVKFGSDVGKFAVNAAGATKKFFENDARNFFERNGIAAKDFFEKDVKGGFEKAGQGIKDLFTGGIKW